MKSTGRIEKRKLKKEAPKRWNMQNIVIIKAGSGDATEEFIVHKDLVYHYSPVLKAAFESNFVERATQTYVLEDVSAGVARLLVQWLYTQDFDYAIDYTAPADINMDLVKLWILADRLLIPGLQNAVIEALEEVRRLHRKIGTGCMHYIYENTTTNSPLRRLFLHWYAFRIHSSWFRARPEHFTMEMMIDIADVLRSAVPSMSMKRMEYKDLSHFKAEEGIDEE